MKIMYDNNLTTKRTAVPEIVKRTCFSAAVINTKIKRNQLKITNSFPIKRTWNIKGNRK